MSVPTFYSPNGSPVAGNSTIVVVDAIADLDAPKLTELNAAGSVTIQCAIENFGVTTDVKWIERKKLCDKIATQRPGNRSYSMDAIELTLDSPQGAQQIAAAKFVEDATLYIAHRPGKDHKAAIAAQDKVIVYEVIVGSADMKPISTDEGEEYRLVVNLGVIRKSSGLLVTVVA